jgi:hypothetical protein
MTLTFMGRTVYTASNLPMQPVRGFGQQNYADLDQAPPAAGGIVQPRRSAISLIGFCVLTTLGAALAFTVMVAGGSVVLADHQYSEGQQEHSLIIQNSAQSAPNPVAARFNGMITDSYCGARHLRGSRQGPAECARTCVRKGARYVLVDGNRRYQLTGGEDALDKLVGQRATVTGTRQGDAIAVNSAVPVPLP